MNFIRKMFFGWLVLLLLMGLALLVSPQLIPWQKYVAKIEQFASVQLGMPVKIANADIAIYPIPGLKLEQIRVGNNNELSVHDMVIYPDWLSLLTKPRGVKFVLTRVDAKQSGLVALTQINAQRVYQKSNDIQLAQVHIKGLNITETTMYPPVLDVTATFKDDSLQTVKANAQDGTVKIHMRAEEVAQPKSYQVNVVITEWVNRYGDVIHNANFDGVLADNSLTFNQFNINIFEGEVKGKAILSWVDEITIKGNLDLQSLDMQPITKRGSSNVYVMGRMTAQGAFEASLDMAEGRLKHSAVVLDYKVKDGVLFGLDFMGSLRPLLNNGGEPGQTRFEEFNGRFKFLNGVMAFSKFELLSDQVSTSGDIIVSPQWELNGNALVVVQHSVGLAEIPIQVAGSVYSPIIKADFSSLSGR